MKIGTSYQSETPLKRYQSAKAAGELYADPHQAQLVNHTQRLYKEMKTYNGANSRRGVLHNISSFFNKGSSNEIDDIKGLYVYGGVGRGKTYFIDNLFICIDTNAKVRMHFHVFMRHIHSELAKLDNVRDPLKWVAKSFSEKYKILFLDEFMVNDIADAMVLARLFKHLFSYDLVLVATSNIAPEDLYKDGLQRAQFLPAIQILKDRTVVFELAGDTDYRLRVIKEAGVYHSPADEKAEDSLQHAFIHLVPDVNTICDIQSKSNCIEILGRKISVLASAHDVLWASFEQLCGSMRSVADYIEISSTYHTLILSQVPVMNDDNKDILLRFINLIDALYESGVKLIVSASTEPKYLYTGKLLSIKFDRAQSRLQEMRSEEYLSSSHAMRANISEVLS